MTERQGQAIVMAILAICIGVWIAFFASGGFDGTFDELK
jgi:hypothetical protein